MFVIHGALGFVECYAAKAIVVRWANVYNYVLNHHTIKV